MSSLLSVDPLALGEAELKPIETPPRYPRLLVLPDDVRERLIQYLDHELALAWQERSLLVEDWIQWQKDYWAKPAQAVKNFPFRRAANIVIPMTAIAVEAVVARLLTTIFSVKPFFSVRPRTKDWVDVAPQVESWFQTEVEDPQSIDMDGFARESLMELVKLGTAVGKTGYERDVRKVNIDLGNGDTVARWVTRKEGATLSHVPLANFLMRLYEKDPQTAAWVGEEHTDVTWAQLKRMALNGRIFPEALESLRSYFGSMGSSESIAVRYANELHKVDHFEPAWKEVVNFVEVWLSFDVDNDGVDEEIVVDYHRESRTILSAFYNWYEDLHRPYRIGVYIPVEGRWAGIGIGKQLEQFQALITTIHRQRLDAGTLANMGQLAIKKTAGYGPDEPIWPGKIWFLENPVTDIREFSLANTQHFAQLSNEEAARQYADKRSGANELILGTPAMGTPPTATSDLAKLAEGNKKFDAVLKNVRRWYSLLGLDLLANYQQFGSRGRSWLVRGEGGKYVEQFLMMPQEDIRRGIHLELSVTDSITNKDIEQQKWINLFTTLSAHYDKALERAGHVASVTNNPSIFVMFAEMALKASNEAMTRLLMSFQVPDIESFLLDLDQLRSVYAGPEAGGIAEPGLAPGGTGLAEAAGGAGLAEALGALGLGGLAPGTLGVDQGGMLGEPTDFGGNQGRD